MTCRAPVRSETGQWMRRSRSPVRNGRISASSVPPPIRVLRCWPTRPTGWGRAALDVNDPGVGTVATVSTRCSGQVQVKAAKSPKPPTWAGPRRRTPQRARCPRTARVAVGARVTAAATWPWPGVVVVHRSPGRCPTTSRRPGTRVTSTRQVTVSPSCPTRSLSALVTVGELVGRVATAHTTSVTSGTPITARSPRPPTAAAATRTTPMAAARPSARVGRQRAVTTCEPPCAAWARCAAGRRRCCATRSRSSTARDARRPGARARPGRSP